MRCVSLAPSNLHGLFEGRELFEEIWYANCDQELATVDENWEANIVSSLREEESLLVSDEGDDEPHTSQVTDAKTAADYLSGLQDFAIAHDKPDLLGLISKSQSIIE